MFKDFWLAFDLDFRYLVVGESFIVQKSYLDFIFDRLEFLVQEGVGGDPEGLRAQFGL